MRLRTRLALRCLPALLGLLLFSGVVPPARATIRYSISVEHPERHLFHVEMRIPDVAGEVTVQMPAWNTLYQIRDFSSHVQQVEAFAGDRPVPIEKLDKLTWRIQGKGTITIRYATYWDEPGPFASQLNAAHAFLNPAMVLLYVPARRGEPVSLTIGFVTGVWSDGTGSSLQTVERMGAFEGLLFAADSYDALADAPIEIGPIRQFNLSGNLSHIHVAVHGDNWKQERVAGALQKICAYELNLMGGAPFQDYTFLLHIGGATRGGGGMEHANSTAISVPSEDYLFNVAAHEFFHLWNVKRIRPATLDPVDYAKEEFTRALWFAEGVTNTYASYTMVRTGLWTKDQFLEDLSAQIAGIESRPANRWQSAEQSSLDAWFEKYPLYNRPGFSVSYYAKGQILGVLLDILIRDRTDNAKSLDDVLRAMNTEFAQKGKSYRDSLDVRLAAERVAGGSLQEFFERYVAGTDPFPYGAILPLAGLELRSASRSGAALGFVLDRAADGRAIVTDLDPDSAAAKAGLQDGDVILRWNDSDPPQWISSWLGEHRAGDKLRLKVRRDAKEVALDVRLGETTETLWQVVEAASVNEKAKRIRNGLLHGVTESAAPPH